MQPSKLKIGFREMKSQKSLFDLCLKPTVYENVECNDVDW